MSLRLRFGLLTAATFGRGDGVAGLVDREVEHDTSGLPYLRGRTLKGLLAEECANLLYALDLQGKGARWRPVGERMFGSPGSTQADLGLLRVGDAHPPASLVEAVRTALADREHPLTPGAVLDSVTAIRRQTSMTEHGAPQRGSLRSMRVVLPGLVLEAQLEFAQEPTGDELALLGVCVLAWRCAGTARNRGRGKLRAWLCDESDQDVTEALYGAFRQEVLR